jgi:hypothetical protein
MMSHIPFGYTIQNGRAVVNEEEAVKIEKLFECFRHNRNTENGSQNVTGEIED